MSASAFCENLQAYAEGFIGEHNIPALSLAIWHNKKLHQGAAGILNLDTKVNATNDAIFQIGSITKVMTACLIMQLVDEGRVELDKPVRHYLREFCIADPGASDSITVRQLLNHTSGMAGDFFPDDYHHEGNLIERYVDRCNLLPLVHPVGQMYSYSNSAFGIAGRLIEVVRGISWYQAMEEYIYQPLGMDNAIADPAGVIRFRPAMGHVFDGNNTERWTLPERPYLTLGLAPVGSTPNMSAADLITFARAHLDGGLNSKGERWLSAVSVKAMQVPNIQLPKASLICDKHAGLGWGLSHYHREGLQTFGHGGATIGFLSMLQVVPELDLAFAVLMNGFRPSALEAATNTLLRELAGIDTKQPEPSAETPVDNLQALGGQYESLDTLITVSIEGDKLKANIVYKVDPLPPTDLELRQAEGTSFAAYDTSGRRRPNIVFLEENSEGIPQYLFNGGRQNRRRR